MATRIILTVSDVADAEKCLSLAKHALERDAEAEFGYWSQGVPNFSAYIRPTKTGVSVRGHRNIGEAS